MKLAKFRLDDGPAAVGILEHERLTQLALSDSFPSLFHLLEAPDPAAAARELAQPKQALALASVTLLAPLDAQEVWAAGVTYIRSKSARMEESEAAASCYDRVYVSPRPELFMKATPHRVAGPGGTVPLGTPIIPPSSFSRPGRSTQRLAAWRTRLSSHGEPSANDSCHGQTCGCGLK